MSINITPDTGGSQQITPDASPVNNQVQPDSNQSGISITPDAQPGGGQVGGVQHGALPYDDVITRTAQKYGVPASFALQIGRNETGAERDRARAKSPVGAEGVMQLMPDTARGLGVHDPLNPEQNIEGGVKYLSQLLKKYHGDTRAAAAAYNMGPGAYDEYLKGNRPMPQETAHYIDELNPVPDTAPEHQKILKSSGATQVEKLAKQFVSAQRAGKNPFQAISHSPVVHPLAHATNEMAATLHWAQQHKLEALIDTVFPEWRVGGSLLQNAEHFGGPEKNPLVAFQRFVQDPHARQAMLHNTGEAVFHPTAAKQEQLLEENRRVYGAALGGASGGHLGLPSHQEIDNFIHHHVWQPLQGIAAPFAKGTEDTLLQLSPSIALSGMGQLANLGIRMGTGTLRAIHGLMPAPMQQAFSFIPQTAHAVENAHNLLFGVRNDLTGAGFTAEGKKARIALENRHIGQRSKALENNKHAAASPTQAEKAYLDHMAQNGSAQTAHIAKQMGGTAQSAHPTGWAGPRDFQGELADLQNPATTPEEREAILNDVSHTVFRRGLGQDSERLFANNQNLYTGHPGDLHNLYTEDHDMVHAWEQNSPLKKTAELGRRAIMWNSLPHGIKNVGENVWNGGGLPALVRGVGGILGLHPVSPQTLDRLQKMGALQQYTHGEAKGITAVSQGALGHIENAWRAGLMETLDRQLGVPTTETEELLRGQMINEKVGDYRNQSAFVRFFRAIGGPYVAFRLGIAPALFAKTLAENPERIANIAKEKLNIQNNRKGKHENDFTFGGPVEDALGLFTDPTDFLMRSTGLINDVSQETGPIRKSGFQQLMDGVTGVAQTLADFYMPEINPVSHLEPTLVGAERPNQKVKLQDQIEDAILETVLATYFKKQPTPKVENRTYKTIRRE